ncbi:porin [Volucribacter amazonae]|uniref:OmpC protein n=1 Tax=Volucribacter amazonae TaxID=256731 RepID=A0A9X4PFA4_9PAST|nr:porin [Volucribacter amazonae]MDG6896194.1 OmpC protein [Volucribacter amazonae]
MKKTLVALAVAATAATSVQAATIYEAEGTKVEVGGSVRLFLGRVGDEQRGDLRNDGSRINIKVNQELGNGLSAFGAYQIRFTEGTSGSKDVNTFGNPSTKHLYAGFAHKNIGALSFGRQATNADDIINDGAFFGSAALNPLTTDGKKTIKFRSAEANGLSFGLDYLFGDSNKSDSTTYDYKQGYAGSVFYDYALGDHKFKLSGVYAQDKYDGQGYSATVTTRKYTTWVTHFDYNYGIFDLCLNYGQYRNKFENGGALATFDSSDLTSTSKKGNYILAEAGVRVIEPSRVYFQWERLDGKSDVTVASGDEKSAIVNRYVAGVDYRLHKNVLTYVEYAQQRAKVSVQGEAHQTDIDNTFGVGLRVYF